jgi:hypothetical protein
LAEYVQVKVSVDPAVALGFKAACAAAGVSMVGELSRFMANRPTSLARMAAAGTDTRGARRKAVKDILAQLDRIRDAEVDYMENIPENLRGGMAFEAAESCVNQLEAAIESLESAY